MRAFEENLQKILTRSKEDPGLLFIWMENNRLQLETYLSNKHALDQETSYIIHCYLSILGNNPIKASFYLHLLEEKADSVYVKILNALTLHNLRHHESAYIGLTKLRQVYANDFFLLIRLFKLCQEKNWIDRGVLLYDKVKNVSYLVDQYIQIMQYGAYFNYINMNFEKSIDILRQQILRLIQHRVTSNIRKSAFNAKLGFEALDDITKLFESHEIQSFPTAGTLLGLYRDNKLLDFDKDIDIALYSDDDFHMVKILLDKNPRYVKINAFPPFSTYYCVYDLKTNITIDILSFKRKKKFFEYGWFLPDRYKEENRVLHFTPFALVKKKFCDREFYIPKDTDLFLNELYGDWKVPDSEYFSALCNNLTKRTLLTDSFSYFEISKNIISQNYKKTIVIINALKKYGTVDPLFAKIESFIEKNSLA